MLGIRITLRVHIMGTFMQNIYSYGIFNYIISHFYHTLWSFGTTSYLKKYEFYDAGFF